MKRMVPLCALAASLVALPYSHLLLAQPPGGQKPEKVRLCHITEVEEAEEGDEEAVDMFVGHVISVSERALPAHCRHGDHQLATDDETAVGEECTRPVSEAEGETSTCDGEAAVTPPWYSEEEPEDPETPEEA